MVVYKHVRPLGWSDIKNISMIDASFHAGIYTGFKEEKRESLKREGIKA